MVFTITIWIVRLNRRGNMAAVKFEKGSEEWMMFQDFYKLTQEMYIPEDTRKYWDELYNKMVAFTDKYNGHKFAIELAIALDNYLQDKLKK